MKNFITIIIILSFINYSNILLAQEFMYELIFEDSEGNLDTLVFGYDELATDTIDIQFGEENIINSPIDTSIDVRITNEWSNRSYYNLPGTYHTKKQITKKIIGPLATLLNVDIITKNWPVAIRWDSTLFMNQNRAGSLITSINPGGWWDTGSPSDMGRIVFSSQNYATFSSNHQNEFNENYAYVNSANDTVPTYWHIISTISILTSSVGNTNSKQTINVFPNPSSGTITIDTEIGQNQFEKYAIHDLSGRIVRNLTPFNESINISYLNPGVYFLQLKNTFGTSGFVKVMRSNVH